MPVSFSSLTTFSFNPAIPYNIRSSHFIQFLGWHLFNIFVTYFIYLFYFPIDMQQKMCGHLVVHRNTKVTLSLSRELFPHESIIPILRRHTFIMNDYTSNVKQKLNSIISDMSEHHWLFPNNPGHNFMRQH